jgi:hypothetical protein
MTPKSEKIFQLATYMYSFRECVSCSCKNGTLKVEVAKGDNRKTVTMRLCSVKGRPDRAVLPACKGADYYLLCTERGDYMISDKYVMGRRITDKSKLVPLGTKRDDTLYDDIRRRLEDGASGWKLGRLRVKKGS